MENEEIIAEKITAKIRSFRDPGMRANYFADQLKMYSPGEIAGILAHIYRKSKEGKKEGYLLTIMSLLYEEVFVEKLGLTKIGEIYKNLLEKEDVDELRDIIHMAYMRLQKKQKKIQNYIPSKDEHVEVRELTLGEKKFLARKPDRNTIEKIRTVRDPQVVKNLLNNPRATERDILAIITKRPNNPEVLRLISTHPRWNMRYNIRKAIVLNPFTPLDVALKFLNFLMKQDLKEITRDKTLSPHLRRRAEELLERYTTQQKTN